MITQSKNIRVNYLARIMALPLLLVLTGAFTFRIQHSSDLTLIKSNGPFTILVDAGHGGSDEGTHAGPILEKNINLAIAKKIQMLAKDYNVKIVMSRDGDFLPGNATDIRGGLENRVTLSQKVKADLFLSIHVNNDPDDENKTGVQIVISSEAKKNPFFAKSKLLGSAMASALKNVLPVDEKLLQNPTGVYVLDQSNCPAVIIECGYISNEKDRAFVQEDKNQLAIAKNILEGAVQFENSQK